MTTVAVVRKYRSQETDRKQISKQTLFSPSVTFSSSPSIVSRDERPADWLMPIELSKLDIVKLNFYYCNVEPEVGIFLTKLCIFDLSLLQYP